MHACMHACILLHYRCDTLEDVMANLHFADNTTSTADSYYKVNLNLT